MSAKINQSDLRKIQKKMKALEKLSKSGLSAEIGRAAFDIANRAKQAAPNNTGNLVGSIGSSASGKTAEVFANANHAPYVEFGTADKVDLTDMKALGIPSSYAAQFKGSGFTGKLPVFIREKGKEVGWRMVQFPVRLSPRPFFFGSAREGFAVLLRRLKAEIKKHT